MRETLTNGSDAAKQMLHTASAEHPMSRQDRHAKYELDVDHANIPPCFMKDYALSNICTF